MTENLLGSHISLISKKDIRYEGTLSYIDAENSCVTLDNVKSWGTEGRASRKDEQYDEVKTLLGSVEFRGQDIKDLQVHRMPQVIVYPPEKSQERVSTHAAPNASTPSTTVEGANSGPTAVEEEPKSQPESEPKSQSAPQTKARKYQPPHKKTQGHEPRGDGQNAGRVEAQARTNRGKRVGPQKKKGGITVSKEDFDFQGALAEFEKDAGMAKRSIVDEGLESGQEVSNEQGDGDASADQSAPTIVVKKYGKNSFFDEISCDALCGRTKTTRQKEKALNTDTFGETGESYRGRSYRGGRWRGRGRGAGHGGRSYNMYSSRRYRTPHTTKTGSNGGHRQD